MAKLKNVTRKPRPLAVLDYLASEKKFLTIITAGFVLSAVCIGNTQISMWLGFLFAGYAAVSNDSIQSLGTFIESNQKRKWWVMWLFVGAIFLATVTFSWFYFDGDVTFQRLLNSEGETQYPHPEKFNYFQIIAPLVLLILTRLRMPVSTTFLLLSVFSASSSGINSMVFKSLSGYGMAFILSFLIWYLGYYFIKKFFKKRKTHPAWTFVQWTVSGSLWATWVMQDGANIAVYLPRQQTPVQFLIFSLAIFAGLGMLFYLRGDKIQKIVSEKIRISDVRAATLVDFSYVLLLIYKLFISTVPMSTTWVFLGVIGGREIAVSLARKKKGKKHKKKARRMILRDAAYAFTGLLISVALASGANPSIREEIGIFFRDLF